MDKAKYQAYLKTAHWREVRDRALQYAEHRCQLCYSSEGVQVHHRTYERLGKERQADLTVLCKKCHEKHHDRLKSNRIVLYRPTDPREARVSITAARFRALQDVLRGVDAFIEDGTDAPDRGDFAALMAAMVATPGDIE